ncbi:MAG: transporter substrate-binding domain-containing protein [Coleofasciculaceae cyanobacterium RL_1_1]|nr:transporter substrate-binding domain-containing protein [Coleofasciculaceae cyanobacterium RL_1_1]
MLMARIASQMTGMMTGMIAATIASGIGGNTLAATPVLDEIRSTGILNVAIASRAIPLSFRYPDGRLDGYCLDLIDEITTALAVELNLNRRPLVNIVESQLDTRFDLIRTNTVQLECGPNTIQAIDGVTFSEPFLVTGLQFFKPTRIGTSPFTRSNPTRDRTRRSTKFHHRQYHR